MTLKLAACARWPQILAGPSLEALVLQVMRATTWCCFKEALFKGGKKLSDADVCETLKTVKNTPKDCGPDRRGWFQMQGGIFDQCCGGDSDKVRCSNSTHSSASSPPGSPDGSEGTAAFSRHLSRTFLVSSSKSAK